MLYFDTFFKCKGLRCGHIKNSQPETWTQKQVVAIFTTSFWNGVAAKLQQQSNSDKMFRFFLTSFSRDNAKGEDFE